MTNFAISPHLLRLKGIVPANDCGGVIFSRFRLDLDRI